MPKTVISKSFSSLQAQVDAKAAEAASFVQTGDEGDGKFFDPGVVETLVTQTNGMGREIAIAIGDLVGPVASQHLNGHQTGEGIKLGGNASYVDKLLRDAIPSTKVGCISKAQAWSEDDDFLCKLIRIVMNFTVTGLNFHIEAGALRGKDAIKTAPAEKDDDPLDDPYVEATQFLRAFQKRYDLRKVVKDLLRDYKVTDSMILYWKMKPKQVASETTVVPDTVALPAGEELVPGLLDISAINPADVDWNNSLGMDILSVRIPQDLKKRIQTAIDKDKSNPRARLHRLPNDIHLKVGEHIESLIKAQVHIRWIEAVAMGLELVELRNDEGDYWLVKTQQRKHHGLARPSMTPVFIALTTRQLLSDGEFTAAFITKHFIMMIQQGESIPTGNLAGSRQNWLTQPEADALMKKFMDMSKAMKVVLDHTVKISFVFPPAEFFNHKKFENCEGRILNWADITYAVTEGEGGSYGSGFIGIKRLLASIVESRTEVGELVTRFFDHPSVRDNVPIEETADVVATFDEQILKEPQQLLREIEFLVKNAIMDHRTAASELGRNPDRMRQSKRRTRAEDKADGSWSPINNNADSADTPSTVDRGGRPANPETTPNPDTRLQSGSPNS